MKLKYFIFVFLLITLTSSSILDVFYKKKYIYNDKTGSLNSKLTVLVKKQKDKFVIDKIDDISTANLVYSTAFALETYSLSLPLQKRNFKLSLKDNTIIVTGTDRGSKIDRKISISDEWIQDFNFGLKTFLNSKKTEKNFVIVNPKDFSTQDMIAIKKGIRKINIKDQVYKVQEIEVTLPGFKSMFWKAQILYDLTSADLVLYKANEGPGTMFSVITIDSQE